jgi:two-component system cell cycle response regulator
MAADRGLLIVDDSQSIRSMVKTILSKEGIFTRYYEAGDGEEAMGLLKSGRDVDLVLMDLIMPRVDGIEVISWMRETEAYQDLPVLVLSVEGRGDVKARGLNLGASDYVVKPFDPGELVARVRLLLKRKEVQDELRRKNQELQKINEELKRLSVTDELTQLFNRSHFYECLLQEMKRSVRYKMKITLLLIDLDDFKLVNDTHGHLAGDEVLRDVSRIIRASVRDSDAVGRFGGEEFIAYLVHSDMDAAMVPAERMRAAVEERVFSFQGGTARTSISIGMAEFPTGTPESRDEFVRRADVALYEAKVTGKNKVVAYSG